MNNQEESPVQQETSRRVYSSDLKLAAVHAVIHDGMTYHATVEELGISSISTLKKWLIAYRHEGEAALEPKPMGRPKGIHTPIAKFKHPMDEMLLRMENEKLLRKLGG